MALIPCPACAKEVSIQAPACPHCGHPIAAPAPAAPTAAPSQQPGCGVGCLVLLTIILVILFFSNPSQESLERQINRSLDRIRAQGNFIGNARERLQYKMTIERTNCAFFSFGTLTVEERFGSAKTTVPVAAGILGMWFDFLEIALNKK